MILKKIFLLSLSLCTLIQSNLCTNENQVHDSESINPPECGRRINEMKGKWQNKIIGGHPADPEDWGWQALLEHDGSFKCGGSLINRQWILTAAHCILSKNPKRYAIRLGLHDRSNPESYSVVKYASDIIVHPKYNTINFHNDIALIKLSSPVNYSDQIIPICLPEQNYDFSNKNSWTTGWGSVSPYINILYSNTLMESETVILDEKDCELRYKILNPPLFDSSVNICAGEEGKSICFGDSGGPLVVKVGEKWQLAGISSWVLTNFFRSCYDGGAFTKTSVYINWVKENIRESSTSSSSTSSMPSISSTSTSSVPLISSTSESTMPSISSPSTSKLTSKFPIVFNSSPTRSMINLTKFAFFIFFLIW